MVIAQNIRKLEEKIAETCQKCGRNPSEITLIAVSKTNPVHLIHEAFDAGLRDFGENKAQEYRDKTPLVERDVKWHFIGHLQTNKVKYIIESAELIHSVDSIKIVKEIQKRAAKIDKIQKILIEVNTSEEDAKYGLESEENLIELAQFCKSSENVDLKGLMTMAPFTDDEKIIRRSFVRLRELFEKLNEKGFKLTELSMGMTNDYQIAIEEGSTMLRIGTAIFGERDYSTSWRDA